MPYPTLGRRTELAPKLQSIIGQQSAATVQFLKKAHNSDGTLTDIGEWTDVAYLAANFTASGTMVWGVDSADQEYLRYCVIGNVLFYRGAFPTTDVTAPVGTELRIRLPRNPATGARYVLGPTGAEGYLIYQDAGGVRTIGRCFAPANESYLSLETNVAANWTATAGDNTSVRFNIACEIV
jgi:hypothetical protein